MTRTLLSAAVVVLVGAVSVSAQTRYEPGRLDDRTYVAGADVWDGYDLPAFVSVVEGYAELERAGQSSRDIENVPLEVGDRIRTTRGRVEILFDDGSVIALDEHTTVTFATATELELLRGRVRAQWQDRGTLSGLTIHTQAGSAIVRARGDYRVTLGQSRLGEAEIELAVTRGSAELANDLGRTLVRERTRALTTARYAPSVPYAYSAPRDEFERWTDHVEADRYGVESARYLPTELRYYGGVFDRHGSWQHHHVHGWVWYPRVSVDWRPYDGGRWSFVIGFGYTWVGGSRWSWPTHHYGRWDRVGARWYWIPARPTYHRAVGYAVPRPSYTVTVAYYNRTEYRTTVTTPRPTVRTPQIDQRRPQSTGQAVPRNSEPARRSLGEGGSAVRGPQSESRGSPSTVRSPQAVPRTAPSTETRPTPQRSAPQAVPRSPEPVRRSLGEGGPQRTSPQPRTAPPPETRPAPQRSSPQPRTAPPPRTAEPQRAAPQRTAPRPEAQPAPQRAAPQRTTPAAPPPSGSRTPTRTAPPPTSGGGGSDTRARSGTAVRRGGGQAPPSGAPEHLST